MIQITEQSELIGKTITEVGNSDDFMSLKFKDNSFCIFKISQYGDTKEIELIQEKINLESKTRVIEKFNLPGLKLNENDFN